MFLHEPPSSGGLFILHILFNMYALYIVGPPLEALLGRVRFVAMYLLTGLAGSVLAYVLTAPNVPELGASGAIFGLFGALLVVGRKLRLNIQPIAVTIGLNLVLTLLPRQHQLAGPHRRAASPARRLARRGPTRHDPPGRRSRSAVRSR